MDLQALLQMFLASEAAEGDTKDIFTSKIQSLAAERGYEISNEQIAQGLAVMQQLYGQYQRGEEMDMSAIMAAFMGGEDNGLASLAGMFMGGQGENAQGADMMQLMGMLNGASSMGGNQENAGMAELASMFMGNQTQGNQDMAQLAQMFMSNMDKE